MVYDFGSELPKNLPCWHERYFADIEHIGSQKRKLRSLENIFSFSRAASHFVIRMHCRCFVPPYLFFHMIEFAPHSPWPKRIKILMYGFLGFVLVAAFLSTIGRYWAKQQTSDRAASTKIKMQAIKFGIKAHHFIKGEYPKTRKDLAHIYEEPSKLPIQLKQLRKEEPLEDAWQRDFRYVCPGEHNPDSYDLWSMGEDGKDGTKDDITNW